MEVRFTRTLVGGEIGIDVEGIGRALARAHVGYVPLSVFVAAPASWRRTYGTGKKRAVNEIRRRTGRTRNGKYDRAVHEWLEARGAFDAKAANLMLLWRAPAELVHPIEKGGGGYICQGLHETSGIPGNWAIDFCAAPGTKVLAVEDATIRKLSGRDPLADTWDSSGVYGWSIHYESRGGYRYFLTHLGFRVPREVGEKVVAGSLLGRVGDQNFRPDHLHLGVTSPLGSSDAKKKIVAVSNAPRVYPTLPV